MRIHSLLSPKCRIEASSISGSGVFATEPFTVGELVAVWGGIVYTEEECQRLSKVMPHFGTHTIGICKGYFLGSGNLFEFDDAELFNHSCEPNTGVRGQILLVARLPIAAGDELTFDYETVDTIPEDFQCRCGKRLCRGKIDGTAFRKPEFQRMHQGYLSTYIEGLIGEGT
jgi:hypothetical protein